MQWHQLNCLKVVVPKGWVGAHKFDVFFFLFIYSVGGAGGGGGCDLINLLCLSGKQDKKWICWGSKCQLYKKCCIVCLTNKICFLHSCLYLVVLFIFINFTITILLQLKTLFCISLTLKILWMRFLKCNSVSCFLAP